MVDITTLLSIQPGSSAFKEVSLQSACREMRTA
jgi:hypothetical protein